MLIPLMLRNADEYGFLRGYKYLDDSLALCLSVVYSSHCALCVRSNILLVSLVVSLLPLSLQSRCLLLIPLHLYSLFSVLISVICVAFYLFLIRIHPRSFSSIFSALSAFHSSLTYLRSLNLSKCHSLSQIKNINIHIRSYLAFYKGLYKIFFVIIRIIYDEIFCPSPYFHIYPVSIFNAFSKICYPLLVH